MDIVYAQKFDPLQGRLWSRTIQLAAPKTDVPNTYAEWQIYVPPTQRLSGFGGNMTVARGTVYGLRDAWNRFARFYGDVWRQAGGTLAVFGGLTLALVAMVGGAIRRGWRGAAAVLGVCSLRGDSRHDGSAKFHESTIGIHADGGPRGERRALTSRHPRNRHWKIGSLQRSLRLWYPPEAQRPSSLTEKL